MHSARYTYINKYSDIFFFYFLLLFYDLLFILLFNDVHISRLSLDFLKEQVSR